MEPMRRFLRKYRHSPTNDNLNSNNSKENDNGQFGKQKKIIEEKNYEGNDSLLELEKSQTFAFRKKLITKGDELTEQDGSWLEIYNTQSKDTTMEFGNNCNKKEIPKQSFSRQSNVLINHFSEKFDSSEVDHSVMVNSGVISVDPVNIDQPHLETNIENEDIGMEFRNNCNQNISEEITEESVSVQLNVSINSSLEKIDSSEVDHSVMVNSGVISLDPVNIDQPHLETNIENEDIDMESINNCNETISGETVEESVSGQINLSIDTSSEKIDSNEAIDPDQTLTIIDEIDQTIVLHSGVISVDVENIDQLDFKKNIENEDIDMESINNCNETISGETVEESVSGQINVSIDTSLEKIDSNEVIDPDQTLTIIDEIDQTIVLHSGVISVDVENIDQLDFKKNTGSGDIDMEFRNNCNQTISGEIVEESYSGQPNVSIDPFPEKFDIHEVIDPAQTRQIVDEVDQLAVLNSDSISVDVVNIDQLDLKTNTESEEESYLVMSVPSLQTLPMRQIEVSSRSSVISCSSFNASIEINEEENVMHNRAPDSGHFTMSESLIQNSIDFKRDVVDTNEESLCNEETSKFDITIEKEQENLKSLALNVEENQSEKYLQNIKTIDKRYSYAEETFHNLSSENFALHCHLEYEHFNTYKTDNVQTTLRKSSSESNKNINNIKDEESLKDKIKSLPPLHPAIPTRRRTRTLSNTIGMQCVEINKCTTVERSSTPPPSYQRHELLHSPTFPMHREENPPDSDGHQKFCFPYPSLTRFPPPRSVSNVSKIPTTGEGENTESDVSMEAEVTNSKPSTAVTSKDVLQNTAVQIVEEKDAAIHEIILDVSEKQENAVPGKETPSDTKACDSIPGLRCCSLF